MSGAVVTGGTRASTTGSLAGDGDRLGSPIATGELVRLESGVGVFSHFYHSIRVRVVRV